ncbi:MAG: ribosomal-processing cysteine protease Prp [Gudongella sp.]|nr:ribosomal-processing cysteine protease Prp [Gudongella sp.]
MISVFLSYNKDGYFKGFQIAGHANYKPYGEDIVCSAVSILGYTTIRSLIDVVKVPEDKIQYTQDDESGFLELVIKNISNDKIKEVELIMKTFEVGIKSIIESYPKYITLEYRGGGIHV